MLAKVSGNHSDDKEPTDSPKWPKQPAYPIARRIAMSVSVQCPSCGLISRFSESSKPTNEVCRRCGFILTVPDVRVPVRPPSPSTTSPPGSFVTPQPAENPNV